MNRYKHYPPEVRERTVWLAPDAETAYVNTHKAIKVLPEPRRLSVINRGQQL